MDISDFYIYLALAIIALNFKFISELIDDISNSNEPLADYDTMWGVHNHI